MSRMVCRLIAVAILGSFATCALAIGGLLTANSKVAAKGADSDRSPVLLNIPAK